MIYPSEVGRIENLNWLLILLFLLFLGVGYHLCFLYLFLKLVKTFEMLFLVSAF